MKKPSAAAAAAKKESTKKERSSGKSTSTQETGPKHQVDEGLNGDDYVEDNTAHLEGQELIEADADQKGRSSD